MRYVIVFTPKQLAEFLRLYGQFEEGPVPLLGLIPALTALKARGKLADFAKLPEQETHDA